MSTSLPRSPDKTNEVVTVAIEETLPQTQSKEPKLQKKQHRWSNDRTLAFFKIVDILRPFAAQHGAVTETWEKTAKEYNRAINESDALSGKAAQDHYKKMLKKHREAAASSERDSGVHEEVTELTTILDSAVEMDDSLQKAAEENDKRKHEQVTLHSSLNVIFCNLV
jgi:hypothetical protein